MNRKRQGGDRVAATDSPSLDALEEQLGHQFTDLSLLETALTHASADPSGIGDYQRLEFVGDRVLGLIVAELLYQAYPNDPEGDLAVRLNALVRAEFCADVAGELGLQSYLRLSKGESRSGIAQRKAVLADLCEAVIAALYLDGGYEAARQFIERHWLGALEGMIQPPRDAKTTLQEWAQGKKLGLPKYVEEGREGPDHAPSFKMKVIVGELPPAYGKGASKRQAEQAAAEALIQREEVKE